MAAARRKPAAKTGTIEEAAEAVATAPQERAPDGVFIVVNRDENGGVGTGIQTVGDVKVTEIQTIIELALKAFRNDVGLA